MQGGSNGDMHQVGLGGLMGWTSGRVYHRACISTCMAKAFQALEQSYACKRDWLDHRAAFLV